MHAWYVPVKLLLPLQFLHLKCTWGSLAYTLHTYLHDKWCNFCLPVTYGVLCERDIIHHLLSYSCIHVYADRVHLAAQCGRTQLYERSSCYIFSMYALRFLRLLLSRSTSAKLTWMPYRFTIAVSSSTFLRRVEVSCHWRWVKFLLITLLWRHKSHVWRDFSNGFIQLRANPSYAVVSLRHTNV